MLTKNSSVDKCTLGLGETLFAKEAQSYAGWGSCGTPLSQLARPVNSGLGLAASAF